MFIGISKCHGWITCSNYLSIFSLQQHYCLVLFSEIQSAPMDRSDLVNSVFLVKPPDLACWKEGSFCVYMAWDMGMLRVRPGHLSEKLLNEAWACAFQYKGYRFQSQSEFWPRFRFSLPTTCVLINRQSVNCVIICDMQPDGGLLLDSLHDVQRKVVNIWIKTSLCLVGWHLCF